MNYREYDKKGNLKKVDGVKIVNDEFYGVCTDFEDFMKSKKIEDTDENYKTFEKWMEEYDVCEL